MSPLPPLRYALAQAEEALRAVDKLPLVVVRPALVRCRGAMDASWWLTHVDFCPRSMVLQMLQG